MCPMNKYKVIERSEYSRWAFDMYSSKYARARMLRSKARNSKRRSKR